MNPIDEVAVSTAAFPRLPIEQVLRGYVDAGITRAELSGGLHDPDMLTTLRRCRRFISLTLHNYFPVPVEPFVLNLASGDATVRRRSIDHVRTALRWSSELGSDVYAVHAGFLFDPDPSQLGKPIDPAALSPRDEAIDRFVESVGILAAQSDRSGVRLLIENNVLSAANYRNFGGNPFLMAEAEEIRAVLGRIGSNVGLLMDVGHLWVTAASLGLDAAEQLRWCDDLIGGYHFSENDGSADTNQPLSVGGWYRPLLRNRVAYRVVEVYGSEMSELSRQRELVVRSGLSSMTKSDPVVADPPEPETS